MRTSIFKRCLVLTHTIEGIEIYLVVKTEIIERLISIGIRNWLVSESIDLKVSPFLVPDPKFFDES